MCSVMRDERGATAARHHVDLRAGRSRERFCALLLRGFWSGSDVIREKVKRTKESLAVTSRARAVTL